MEPQKPSIGRIVHFNRQSGDFIVQEAALIVAVNDGAITCVVWNSGGTSRTETSVKFGDGAGSWCWPARV